MKIQKMVDQVIDGYNNAATIARDLGLTLDADRVKITIPRKVDKIMIRLTGPENNEDLCGYSYGIVVVRDKNAGGWIAVSVGFSEVYNVNYYYLIDNVEQYNDRARVPDQLLRLLLRIAPDHMFIDKGSPYIDLTPDPLFY